MNIQELIDAATKHGCNIGIISVVTEEENSLELRLSRSGYHVSRRMSQDDISAAKIDIIAFEFNVMMDKLETELAERR